MAFQFFQCLGGDFSPFDKALSFYEEMEKKYYTVKSMVSGTIKDIGIYVFYSDPKDDYVMVNNTVVEVPSDDDEIPPLEIYLPKTGTFIYIHDGNKITEIHDNGLLMRKTDFQNGSTLIEKFKDDSLHFSSSTFGNQIRETNYIDGLIRTVKTYLLYEGTKKHHSFNDGPSSIEHIDGDKNELLCFTWHKEDFQFRENGPSLKVEKNGKLIHEEYTNIKGELHRDKLPASIYYYDDGAELSNQYFINGICQREKVLFPSFVKFDKKGDVSFSSHTNREGKVYETNEITNENGNKVVLKKTFSNYKINL